MRFDDALIIDWFNLTYHLKGLLLSWVLSCSLSAFLQLNSLPQSPLGHLKNIFNLSIINLIKVASIKIYQTNSMFALWVSWNQEVESMNDLHVVSDSWIRHQGMARPGLHAWLRPSRQSRRKMNKIFDQTWYSLFSGGPSLTEIQSRLNKQQINPILYRFRKIQDPTWLLNFPIPRFVQLQYMYISIH